MGSWGVGKLESWKVGELGSWGVGELERRFQVSGDRCKMLFSTFYILPSTDSEMAIGRRRWASGRRDEATGVQAVREPPCRRLAVPKPEIPNKFKTKTLRNQPRNTLKGNNVTGGNALSITAPGSLYITARQVASSPDSSFSHHRPAEAVERVGELGSWKEGDRYQVTGGRTCQTDTCPLPFSVERVESGSTVPLFMLPGDGNLKRG